MSKPKSGRQHSPVPPRRPHIGGDAGRQPADLLARIEDAETRLKQLIPEAHGLTGDLKNDMRRYKEAEAALESLMADILGHRDKLQKAVAESFQAIVEREAKQIRDATHKAMDAQLAEIGKITAGVTEAIQEHEAKLLGCEDADQLVNVIAGRVFAMIKEDVEDMAGEKILAGVPVDCPENKIFLVTLGLDPAKMPWDKPEGAVRAICMKHQGPVWLGPGLQDRQERITKAGGKAGTVCIICAARMGADMKLKGRTVKAKN